MARKNRDTAVSMRMRNDWLWPSVRALARDGDWKLLRLKNSRRTS